MSNENVKKFYEAIRQDEALKQKFMELSQKYQGEPMDEAKRMSVFEKEALPLAALISYSFTVDDLKQYEMETQQANMNRELSDEELEAVTGGDCGSCSGIGAGFGSFQMTITCSHNGINFTDNYFCIGLGAMV